MERINYINGEYRIGEKKVYLHPNGIFLREEDGTMTGLHFGEAELFAAEFLQNLGAFGFDIPKKIKPYEVATTLDIILRAIGKSLSTGELLRAAIHSGIPVYYDFKEHAEFIVLRGLE